jgi:hypothetical protein
MAGQRLINSRRKPDVFVIKPTLKLNSIGSGWTCRQAPGWSNPSVADYRGMAGQGVSVHFLHVDQAAAFNWAQFHGKSSSRRLLG